MISNKKLYDSLSDEMVLSLYEKDVKEYISFMAAKAEAQRFLSKVSSFEIETQSGYENRIAILESLIKERNLLVPEEWTKYPKYVDIYLVIRVLELEKARRMAAVRNMNAMATEERKEQIKLEFNEIIQEAVLSLLEEANIEHGKMLIAERIAQSVLEVHGYTEKVNLSIPLNKRYWDISMAAKARGYEVIDRPAQNVKVDITDVEEALVETKEDAMNAANPNETTRLHVLETVFSEAIKDTEKIKLLLDRETSKIKSSKFE